MIPKSFRIFRKGWNTSTKGPVLFDTIAAKAVMQDYIAHGADIMLDLEHLSLDPKSPNYDPNARGWFKLGLLSNGELWALGFKPAGDGGQRLEAKTQRYISPFFGIDKATKRVKFLVNAALTALPASDKPMALVPASRVTQSQAEGTELLSLSITTEGYNQMDLTAILQCLGLPPDATIDDIVAAIKALQGTESAEPVAPVANSEPGNGGASAPMVKETVNNPAASLAPAAMTPKKTTVSIQHNQLGDSASAAAMVEMSQRVATLEKEKLDEKRNALILANAKKLTPVLEKWARTQSIETLTGFFAGAAEQQQVHVEAERETRSGATTVQLTQAEQDLCRLTGTDPAQVLKYKQDQAQGAA